MLLKNVIKKYERIVRNMPKTMESIHREAFKDWNDSLPQVAIAALGILEDDEVDAAMDFIDTFRAATSATVMRFTLSAPGSEIKTAESVTAEDVEAWVRRGAEVMHDGDDFYDRNVVGKEFDMRDDDIDSTVRKMQGILIYAQDSGGSQQEARMNYLPVIADFISRTGVPPAKVEEWSRLILKAWVRHVHATWPGIARRHLRKAIHSTS